MVNASQMLKFKPLHAPLSHNQVKVMKQGQGQQEMNSVQGNVVRVVKEDEESSYDKVKSKGMYKILFNMPYIYGWPPNLCEDY